MRGSWLSGSVVRTRPVNFPGPARDLHVTDDHFVGQMSAVGQPTRSTQPFILTGSINE